MSTSTENRLRSLERANEVKKARTELKRRIQAGDVFAASVLLDPPPEAERLAVGQLLLAQRRWGTIRMRQFLRRLGIPEFKPVGRLTDRQRRELAEELGWQEEER